MQKHFFILLTLVFLTTVSFTTNPQLNVQLLRKQLIIAINRHETTDSLYKTLGLIRHPSALITGYIGVLEALKAKHTWNPYYKIKYLNNAENSFKEAINRDPHNIEIRFMRFSVEHNVPAFLGYNKNLNADKQVLIKQIEQRNYEHSDKELIVTAIQFLINSKHCNASESQTLTKQLAALN